MRELYFVICIHFDSLEDLHCVLEENYYYSICALIQRLEDEQYESKIQCIYVYTVQRVFPF